MRRRLTEIANECGTDKGTLKGNAHAYTTAYELFLEAVRDEPLKLLEIGLAIAGPEVTDISTRSVADAPSVRMWHEYLPNAHIYGLDISDFSKFQTDWFTFFQGDCGKSQELRRVADAGVQFDIIIDDGSHASYHQQLTFVELFSTLKPGGLYFIEDMNWVPKQDEAKLPQVPRTRELLADFLERGEFGEPVEGWEAAASQVANVFMFDDDQLEGARRLYNTRARNNGAQLPVKAKLGSRTHGRRLQVALDGLARAMGGGGRRMARGRLAVIQKLP